MLHVKYTQFSPRCRKSHVKEQIQYEVTCFSPFLATRCLHVAYDFRVYSQLSLPICRLSAYTLLRLNMTEKLFTGTLNHNQNKTKQKLIHCDYARMSVKRRPPYTPPLYSKTLVYRGFNLAHLTRRLIG